MRVDPEILVPGFPVIEKAKQSIINSGIASEDIFLCPEYNIDLSKKIIPITFVVDTSISVKKVIGKITDSIHKISENIYTDSSGILDGIDISIITFDDRVRLLRDFSSSKTVTEYNDIKVNNSSSSSFIIPAMFAAWYRGELYKTQVKNIKDSMADAQASGFDYRQPTIVLISDFQNNDHVMIDSSMPLRAFLPNLFRDRAGVHKLGLIGVTHGDVNQSWKDTFKWASMLFMDVENFCGAFKSLLNKLISTIMDEGNEPEVIMMDDIGEDAFPLADEEYLRYIENTNPDKR